MSLRDGPLGDIRVPLTWSAAAALVIAIILAGALLLSRQHDPMKTGAYDAARRAVDSVEGPVGGALSAPVRWSEDGLGFVGSYFFAASENRKMKAELRQAQNVRAELVAEQLDNQRLRAVLGIRTDPPLPHVAAETIADSRGPFANTRLANVGSADGVTEGNPVVSEHGLVGRIVGVAPHVSRILLLTDASSRTPVIVVRTNGRAILSGDGGVAPKLDYVRSATPIRAGDRVLTSGDGGVFPRGLPVGTIQKGLDGAWRVVLDSDAAPIDFLQVLLFTDFAQLVDEKALAPKELPTAMTEEPSQSIMAPPPITTAKPTATTAPKPNPKPTAATTSAAKPKPVAALAKPSASLEAKAKSPPPKTATAKPVASGAKSKASPAKKVAAHQPATAVAPPEPKPAPAAPDKAASPGAESDVPL